MKTNTTMFQSAYVVALLAASSVSSLAQEAEEGSSNAGDATESTTIEYESPVELTTPEVSFLNCSLECGLRNEPGELFQCLGNCQRTSRIPPDSLAKVMSMSLGSPGVTEEECREIVDNNFVCPMFSKGCCCEGFFDCENMQQVVIGCKITTCVKDLTTNREICKCDVMRPPD